MAEIQMKNGSINVYPEINAQNVLKVIDCTGSTGTINAYSAKSVALTHDPIPSGYSFFCFLPLRTNGFVGYGYQTSDTNAWVGNPTGSSVSGTITGSILVMKD